MQQQKIVSDPFEYAVVVVVTDSYKPTDYEYATKGDDPPINWSEMGEKVGNFIHGHLISLTLVGFVSGAALLAL